MFRYRGSKEICSYGVSLCPMTLPAPKYTSSIVQAFIRGSEGTVVYAPGTFETPEAAKGPSLSTARSSTQASSPVSPPISIKCSSEPPSSSRLALAPTLTEEASNWFQTNGMVSLAAPNGVLDAADGGCPGSSSSEED